MVCHHGKRAPWKATHRHEEARPVAPEFCQRAVNPPVVIAGFRSISRDLAIEEFKYVFARYLGPGPLVDHGVSNVLQRNKRSLGISDIRLDA